MKIPRMMAITATLAVFMAAGVLVSAASWTAPQGDFDAAGTYKAKCVACHGPKAEKKFDRAKSDADHLQTILKGKKMEKPPNMPGYEEKGVTEAQAKALLEFMKSIPQ